MKTLLLMRHAKAQPDTGDDKSRQLEQEGRQDAERIGVFLGGLLGAPDAIIASDVARARQTAEIVAAALDMPELITLNPDAYTFEAQRLLPVVRGAPDMGTLLLVAHSPALEEMTAELVGTNAKEVALPPGGFTHLAFEVNTWDASGPGSARLLGMVTPATV